MVGLVLFQLLERDIHGIFKGLVILAHFHRIDQLDKRGEVLLFFGGFVMDVADQGTIQKGLCLYPEVVTGFAVPFGITYQGVDQLQNVLFRVDVGERVVVHGLLEVQGIENLDLIPVLLQRMAAGNHDVPFGIGDDEAGGIGF